MVETVCRMTTTRKCLCAISSLPCLSPPTGCVKRHTSAPHHSQDSRDFPSSTVSGLEVKSSPIVRLLACLNWTDSSHSRMGWADRETQPRQPVCGKYLVKSKPSVGQPIVCNALSLHKVAPVMTQGPDVRTNQMEPCPLC